MAPWTGTCWTKSKTGFGSAATKLACMDTRIDKYSCCQLPIFCPLKRVTRCSVGPYQATHSTFEAIASHLGAHRRRLDRCSRKHTVFLAGATD